MKPEYLERVIICKSCDHLLQKLEICKKCGCYMPWKTQLDFAKCPIGKWGKITRNPDGSVINSEDTNTPNQEEQWTKKNK